MSISNQKKKRIERSISNTEVLENQNYWLICQKLFQLVIDALIVAPNKERKKRVQFVTFVVLVLRVNVASIIAISSRLKELSDGFDYVFVLDDPMICR